MERKRLEEERKMEEGKRGKLEEVKKRLAEKKVNRPALSQSLSELLSLIPEYTISQPAPTDPPEVKELLGVWTGKWQALRPGLRDGILIVKSIDIDKKLAQVINAWGDSPPQWKIQIKKGYIATEAKFVPGEKPILKWGDGSTIPQFEFVLKGGNLEGSAWHRSTSDTRITMTKVP